jgi:hypothetical protein
MPFGRSSASVNGSASEAAAQDDVVTAAPTCVCNVGIVAKMDALSSFNASSAPRSGTSTARTQIHARLGPMRLPAIGEAQRRDVWVWG